MLARLLLAVGAIAGAAAADLFGLGQERCNQVMCIQALRQGQIDTYTLRPKTDIPLEHFGWMGVGFGMQMVGSNVVIFWPNKDGTFTMSQRHASGHHMPEVSSDPPRLATMATDSERTFSNSSTTQFSFTMPVPADVGTAAAEMMPLIWAMSRTNPESKDPNAALIQHTWRGLEFFNMSETYVPGSAPINQRSMFPVTGKTMKETGRASFVLIAHIVCGCLAAMMVLPGGVVVPRITRGLTTSRWWFHFHAINQGLTALALVTAAFAIALGFGGELNTRHRKTGVALFSLIILQTILGMFSHWYRPSGRLRRFTFETKRGRGPSNFLHVAFGIICVAVGWAAAWTGLTNEWAARGHGTPAKGWRYGWGIFVMLWLIAYIFGIIFFLPRQLRIESRQRELDRQEENHKVYRGSAVALANEYYMEQRRQHEYNSGTSGEFARGHHPNDSFASLPGYPSSVPEGFYGGKEQRISTMSGMTGLSRLTSVSEAVSELPRPEQARTASYGPYGSSSTSFDYQGRPSFARENNRENSPPSKYKPTFTSTGPPKPPSPLRTEGLDGDAFASKEREGDSNSKASYELPPMIFDAPMSKTPSPKLPWAGQINPLARKAGGMI